MPGMDWDETTATERLIAEQAVMNLRALNKACRGAADGQVLAVAERLAVEQGRELTRRILEVSLAEEGAEVEKKRLRGGPAPVDGPKPTTVARPVSS